MPQPPASIHIGTSGWHYNHWRGVFYPERFPASKMLAFYCERFDTVELNNTFYRLPTRNALEEWRDSTPKNLRIMHLTDLDRREGV